MVLVLCLMFLELFLRVSGIAQPLWTEIDNTKGKRFQVNEHFSFYNEGFSLTDSDESGFTTFNSDRKESIKLNFYGDSFSEGHQVFKRHHFLNLIANRKKAFDCVNLSMSGFDFSDTYARYMMFDSVLNPDHSFFFLSDDDFEQDDSDPFIPTVHLDQGKLKLSQVNEKALLLPKVKWILPALQNSALLNMVRNGYRQVEQGNTKEIIFDGLLTKENLIVQPKKPVIAPVVQEILNNWNRRNCTIIYRGKKVMPKKYKKLLQAYQIPLIDLENLLRRNYKGNIEDLYYHKGTDSKGHWNLEAHSLIADILYEKLTFKFK